MEENKKEETSLSIVVKNELLEPTIDTAIDYAEIGLDQLIDNELLSEIPIIKTVVGITKTGLMIKERHFIKKLLTFLSEFHSNDIDQKKLKEFQIKIKTDFKYQEKVIDQIIILNDRFLEEIKSKILAKLFISHIENKIDWNHFKSLTFCLDSLNPEAIGYLNELEKIDFKTKEGNKRDDDREAVLFSSGIAYLTSSWSSSLNISQIGKDLFNYGIKNNYS